MTSRDTWWIGLGHVYTVKKCLNTAYYHFIHFPSYLYNVNTVDLLTNNTNVVLRQKSCEITIKNNRNFTVV